MSTHILLVDDDQVDRASVRRALGKSGLEHTLVEAHGGISGLALARAQPFDCVLLDYRLPDVDTFDLLETLLSPDGGSHAVLMLTGESDQELALRLMRAGALDYLSKSEVTPSSLARAIRYATARREFLAQLKSAREDAEEKSLALDMLNRQKSLLFSIIAHDLRNPFQVLLGLSTVLGEAVASRDHLSIERRAQGIRQAAEQAYNLMESLFAWASLQMDTVDVTLSAVDVCDVAQNVLAGAAQSAADKGIVLQSRCEPTLANAHRDMLATVLRNLVSNAVKFTLPGGSVTVTAERHDGAVEIAVSDTGIGMPAGKLENLFKLDRRATTNGTAGERGSGLGLLLCRDLAERLGSQLTVRSAVNHGTTFTLRLDEAAPPALAADFVVSA